ncbi:hypothetical protein BDV96DRAFT_195274 [Lophiotrema nucula]|uniref:Uncharacterized protein n=1 Tax=Lophiotrema nucula TaxID=690887 RepID=A0A6A5YUD1_9PLEO|nr:hypothetical protein BDV96DRAFT_195274 [Lophiotrema nucula]
MRSLTQLRLGLLLLLSILCAADPNPEPEPEPEPEADPEAQTYTNNAPFSGAIYIVDPNGQQITAQGQNWCPNFASLSCGSMGSPSWCCPSGYTCATVANSGIIGCCPAGSSCAGSVNGAAVTTVTVQAASAQTSVV